MSSPTKTHVFDQEMKSTDQKVQVTDKKSNVTILLALYRVIGQKYGSYRQKKSKSLTKKMQCDNFAFKF